MTAPFLAAQGCDVDMLTALRIEVVQRRQRTELHHATCPAQISQPNQLQGNKIQPN